MVTLYLVRHGETAENAARILQGHLPCRLNEQGREQARRLRDELREKGFRPDVLLTSDLARAAETAAILGEGLGMAARPEPLLRERDWGELAGRPIAEVRDRPFPESVETVEAMLQRSRKFLRLLLDRFDGQTVLAVSHGLFGRCLQAGLHGKALRDIPPMGNTEVRRLCILRGENGHIRPEETGAVAE